MAAKDVINSCKQHMAFTMNEIEDDDSYDGRDFDDDADDSDDDDSDDNDDDDDDDDDDDEETTFPTCHQILHAWISEYEAEELCNTCCNVAGG